MHVFQLSGDFVERHHVVRNLQFHPDGHTLFGLIGPSGDVDAACWWDLREDTVRELITPDGDPGDFWTGTVDPVVNADLELFASAGDYEGGPRAQVLDLWAKPTENRDFYSPNALNHERLAFVPGSNVLFTALSDVVGNVTVLWWDVDAAFENHDSNDLASDSLELEGDIRPQAMACSPDGVTVVIGGTGDLRVLDFTLWRETRLQPRSTNQSVTGLMFSNDGSLLLVRQGGVITVWDTRRWKPLTHLTDGKALTAAAFSPDGRTLALASSEGTVSFRDVATFTERVRFGWEVGPLHSVAFAPDGLTCAAGADYGRVVLWDVES